MNPSTGSDARAHTTGPKETVAVHTLLDERLAAVFNEFHNAVFDAHCTAGDEILRAQTLRLLRSLTQHQAAISDEFCTDVETSIRAARAAGGDDPLHPPRLLDAFAARCAVLPLDPEQQGLLLRTFARHLELALAELQRNVGDRARTSAGAPSEPSPQRHLQPKPQPHAEPQPAPPRLAVTRGEADFAAPVTPADTCTAPLFDQTPPPEVEEQPPRGNYARALGGFVVAIAVLIGVPMLLPDKLPQPASQAAPEPAAEVPTIASVPPAETAPSAPAAADPSAQAAQLEPLAPAAQPDPSTAAAQAAPAPPPAPDTRLAQQVQYLLQRGDRAFAELRLSEPFEDSAAANYLAALAIDDGNAQATRGLDRIVDAYVSLARFQLRKGKPVLAREYLHRAQSVRPDASALAQLSQEIERAGKARRR